jgi:hypothetical protein
MKDNGTRNADAILASIEQTRSEMDSTLHAIEARLTPGQVFEQGLNYLRNSGGGEFFSNLATSVKDNPMPVVVAGVGLAWLMVMHQRDGGDRSTWSSYNADLQAEGLRGRAADAASATRDTMADAANTARDKVADAANATRDKLSSAVGTTRDKVAHAVDSARAGLGATTDRAQQAWQRTSDTTRQQIDRARTGYRYVVQEQPLALGAVGFGIGALLAAVAPRTDEEDRVMGGAADRLKERVTEAGREQLDRAQAVVAEASESMRATTQGSDAQRSAVRPADQQSAESRPGDRQSAETREKWAASAAVGAESPRSGRSPAATRGEGGPGPLDE